MAGSDVISYLAQHPVLVKSVGVLFIFLSLVVFPQTLGVGPLSTNVSTSTVSADYDPATNYLLATINLFQGVSSPSEIFTISLSHSAKGTYKISTSPVNLTASLTSSDIEYRYNPSGSGLPIVQCFHGSATISAGKVLTDSDYVRAINAAIDNATSQMPESPAVYFPGGYKVFVEDVHHSGGVLVFGGDVSASVSICGVRPDSYYLYSYVDREIRSCFSLALRTSDNKTVALSKPICNDVGAGTQFNLVSNGRVVGSVIYNGMLETYLPADLATPPSPYLVVERTHDKNVTVTGVYVVPSDASVTQYLSATTQFAQDISTVHNVSSTSYEGLCSLSDDLGSDIVLLHAGGSDCPTSVPYAQILSLYQQAHSYVSTILSNPLSHYGMSVQGTIPNTITLQKDVTSYSQPIAAHQITIRLNAKFVGLTYLRARPRILAVAPEGNCTDTGCNISIRIKNDTTNPKEVGPVTVTVSGKYVHAQKVISFDSPGQVKVVSFFIVPRNISSPVEDNITVTALAPHPISPAQDVYHTILTITPSATCAISAPRCQYDANTGTYYYLYCPSKYSDVQRMYCAQGQGCVDGQGCVNDIIQSITCTSTDTYSVQYQYSGVQTGQCSPGTVCDANLASQNRFPPCRKMSYCELHPSAPQCSPSPSRGNYTIHVGFQRASYKDLARGLLLVGLALVMFP